ncbi:Tyrosinase [Tolypocladium ophioglossoides CBS 100239]|uniref:tyrosinase n=1 Tax=Tolypocladium ophioglossoides (strain CBS 100239) TaxID=1163406 RepID=A0A0L0N6W4_TOLOC|nr:Tyrosinase [Tolypocladium ophioglossoides CBS 100239]
MRLKAAAIAFLALGTAPFAVALDPYPVTGVSVDPKAGSVPLRQNINDLQSAGGAPWDLYIRALSAMQAANERDPLSYFQIEGIHGRPFVEWNGTGGQQSTGWAGYCPHGEPLFASWHRPYVCLFEQVLVSNARQIASKYPQKYRQQYEQAANNLRAPYWDWAADSTVPPATVPTTVEVNFPNGQGLQRRSTPNPLYTYKIPPAVLNGEFGTFDSEKRPETIRCPAPGTYPATANSNLASRPYKQWIYDAFTRATNFTDFAYMSNNVVSLEQIHNGIHWDAACGQQFVSPDLAAFDPLFMLHHANVDRLWAYWQALRPDQDIFNYSYKGLSRFATPGGTLISPRSPLTPFFAPHRVPLTTESVRSIKSFGYSYQELEYWKKSPAQMKQDATVLINRLYSTGSASRRSSPRGQPPQVRRYFAQVHLDRAEVEKPCQVNLYLDGNKAGSLVVMNQPADGVLTAGLPLDEVIQQSDMHAMSANETVNAINGTLTVVIVKADGSTIDITKVPSLKVDLEDVMVTKPVADDQFPKFGASRLRNVGVKHRHSLIETVI